MINIELFPKVNDRSTHSVQSLQRLLKWSTSNEILKQNTCLYQQWLKDNPNATKQEKSQKKVFYFPAVTFGGTFTGTGTAKDINVMSGLSVLDFDHIKNLPEVRNSVWKPIKAVRTLAGCVFCHTSTCYSRMTIVRYGNIQERMKNKPEQTRRLKRTLENSPKSKLHNQTLQTKASYTRSVFTSVYICLKIKSALPKVMKTG